MYRLAASLLGCLGLVALLFAVNSRLSLSAAALLKPKHATQPVLLAVLDNNGEHQYIMDLILVIDSNGKWVHPYPLAIPESQSKSTLANARAWCQRYLGVGRTYNLLYGGQKLAEVRRISQDDSTLENDVVSDNMAVRLVQQAPITHLEGFLPRTSDTYERPLVTNLTPLPGMPKRRQTPTSAEKATLTQLAEIRYQQKGLNAQQTRSLITVSLNRVPVQGESHPLLIGGFQLREKGHEQSVLFLIAAWRKGAYRVSYHEFWQSLTPPEITYFVDTIDLDQDGVDEIVTEDYLDEDSNFTIFKRQGSDWKPVYHDHGFSPMGG